MKSGNWIWNKGDASPRNEAWCFRKKFTVDIKALESATVKITGDSKYYMYFNGELIGRGPVRSWHGSYSYDTYDITRCLKDGKNIFAAIVLHHGISTLSYVRGKGGLLVEIELVYPNETVNIVSDESFKTAPYRERLSYTQRISCQQAFTERIDFNRTIGNFTSLDYDDSFWEDSAVVGKAGCEPWGKLAPRDIPFLTEEIIYPKCVDSLCAIKPCKYSAVIDVRNYMLKSSEHHADFVSFSGFIAFELFLEAEQTVRIGSVTANALRAYIINGETYERSSLKRYDLSFYYEGKLRKGSNLVVVDVSSTDLGNGFHIAIDAESGFEIRPLIGTKTANPFICIGPVEARVNREISTAPPLDLDREIFGKVYGCKTKEELLTAVKGYINEIEDRYFCQDDVFALNCLFKKSEVRIVPAEMQMLASSSHGDTVVMPFADGDTEITLDFGKIVCGYISFDIDAKKDTVIDFYGYEFKLDGKIQHSYEMDNTMRVTFAGGRVRFTSLQLRGLRYLVLTIRNSGGPVHIHDIHICQTIYPSVEVGSFICDDFKLNKIWEISKNTMQLCMLDTFVDCPTYEQVFWVGDCRNEALVSNYLFNAEKLIKRCLKLVPQSARMTDLLCCHVPSGWNCVIPNWTFLWVLSCRDYYNRTGDIELLKDRFPEIANALFAYERYVDERGLLTIDAWNFLDWANIDQPNSGAVAHQNMLFVWAIKTAINIAEIVGVRTHVNRLVKICETVTDGINTNLWNPDKKAYIDCIFKDGRKSSNFSVQTQLCAYLSGVVDVEKLPSIKHAIINQPEGFTRIGSPFMSFFHYEAFADFGLVQEIFNDILLNYGDFAEKGATTCWETYDQSYKYPGSLYPSRSHCHAWSAGPVYFIGKYLLGINLDSEYRDSVTISPNPCGLRFLKGRVPLYKGGAIDIRIDNNQQEKHMNIYVNAPSYLDISVCLPDGYTGGYDIEQY